MFFILSYGGVLRRDFCSVLCWGWVCLGGTLLHMAGTILCWDFLPTRRLEAAGLFYFLFLVINRVWFDKDMLSIFLLYARSHNGVRSDGLWSVSREKSTCLSKRLDTNGGIRGAVRGRQCQASAPPKMPPGYYHGSWRWSDVGSEANFRQTSECWTAISHVLGEIRPTAAYGSSERPTLQNVEKTQPVQSKI